MNATARSAPELLMITAVAGVLRNAQDGELPLFAWTLGLSQPDLLVLLEECFPALGRVAPMPEKEYAVLGAAVPPDFHALVTWLRSQADPGRDTRHTEWVARAVAAACMGERHLWQDLGLTGRPAVSALLHDWFPDLHDGNTADLKLKRYLLACLGQHLGKPGLQPPGCGGCDQHGLCFNDPGARRAESPFHSGVLS